MKTSKRNYFIIALLLVLLVVAVVIISSYRQSVLLRASVDNVALFNEKLDLLEKVLTNAIDNSTGSRGFALTGESKYLTSIRQTSLNLSIDVVSLKKKYKADTAVLRVLDSLAFFIEKRINFSDTIILVRKQSGLSAAAVYTSRGNGDFYLSNIRRIITNLQVKEHSSLAEHQKEKKDDFLWLNSMLFILLLAVFIFFGALFFITQREIEQRKRMQEDLSDFNTKLKQQVIKETNERTLVFERIRDAFVALDNEWRFTYMNQKAGEIFGRDPVAVIGKNIWSEYPDAFGQRFHQMYERAFLQQEYISFEEYYEPSCQWFEAHVYPAPEGLSIFLRDITFRKKAEMEIIETNQMLESAEAQALLGSWSYDVITQKGRWSKQMFHFFDLPFADEPPSFSDFLELIHEDDRERIQTVLGNMLQGQQPEAYIYRTNDKKMPLRYLQTNWYVNKNEKGGIVKFTGTLMDVTQPKLAEWAISKEKELSDSIINSLPGVFYLYNQQGKFLRWNKNFETVTGYNSEEMLKRIPLDFFLGEERELLEQKIANVFVTGEDFVESNFVTKAGDQIPYFFTGRSIQYNGELCLMGVGVDISKQRKATEMLALSEQKYRFLFADNPMPMWLYSIDTLKFKEVNEAAIKHYGYSKEEFLQMTIKDIRPAEDVDRLVEITSKEYRGMEYVGKWRHKKKNGEVIIVEINTHDTIHDGEHVRLVLSVDITEKVEAEKKLLNSLDEIRQLTAYLQEVREAERKHIGREIHDELGQQLTAIKMDVAWIEKKLHNEESPFKQKISNINFLLDSSNRSIRKILTELRIGVLEHQNLNEALKWLGNQFAENTGIALSLSIDDISNISEAASVCFFRIFQESLTNITRYANATKVSVLINNTEADWILKIEDNGKGFDTVNLKKSKSFGILGMKERVHSLHGEFSIESEPGKGTKIVVSLPIRNG